MISLRKNYIHNIGLFRRRLKKIKAEKKLTAQQFVLISNYEIFF